MNRNGAVLIMVLLIMAVAVSGVLAIEEISSKDYDYSESVYEDNQAMFYFHSAIKVAIKLLQDDDNGYDSKDDIWYGLPPFRASDNAVVSMNIVPLNAKIDINNIKGQNSSIVVKTQRAAAVIFKDEGVDVPLYFKKLLRWMNHKNSSNSEYAFRYNPIGGNFFSLKEIDFVDELSGFSDTFHNVFTVENTSDKININFAPDKVLEAYLPEIADCAEDIIKYRQKKPFKNITELRNVDCIDDESYLKIQPFITTESSIFAVTVDVDINNIHRYATAVISRASNSVKVVKYFEGKGFYE